MQDRAIHQLSVCRKAARLWPRLFVGALSILWLTGLPAQASESLTPWECSNYSGNAHTRCVEAFEELQRDQIAALEERKRRAEQAVDREAEQAKSQKMQTAISFGTTLLSSFLGRKSLSLTTLGRATTAARGVGRSMKESEDVGRAQESVEAINKMMADLDAEFKAETDSLEKSFDAQTEVLETITLKPTKANIAVKMLSLAWAPYWQDSQGQTTPGWQ